MKVVIAKVTSSGEQINVEINGSFRETRFVEEVQAAFDLGDRRMIAMNRRIMDSNRMMARLAKEYPEAYTACNQVLGVLLGDPRFDTSPDKEALERDLAAQQLAKKEMSIQDLADLAMIEGSGA